jgi:hypothetical protein
MVELQGLPAIDGYIRWSDGEESGVAFDTMIQQPRINIGELRG